MDTRSGKLLDDRLRIATPEPATPQAVADVVGEIVSHFHWRGPVGCGFPAVVRQGQVYTAANIAHEWIGANARDMFEKASGCEVTVVNDADAAGYAEMHFGAGRGQTGVVLILTLGTGIGSALFVNGHLVTNTELGHIEINGKEAEKWTAESVREAKDLSWKKWARRLDTYLHALERYLWPDLIILGGGVSKKSEKFVPRLSLQTRIVPAELLNDAGIVGAALAHDHERRRRKEKRSLG